MKITDLKVEYLVPLCGVHLLPFVDGRCPPCESARTASDTWVDDWVATPVTVEDVGLDWIHSRPPVVQDLMRRFPPACLVRTKPGRDKLVPVPGSVGIVISYLEAGSVRVMQSPNGELGGECAADDLELVACKGKITSEAIAAVLDGSPS